MGSWDARAAAAALARRQHGLLTTAQLSDAGIDPRTLARLVRPGLIAPMRRGVYRLPGAPATWAQAALAAVLAAGPDALTSHLTAARLWGLLGPGSGPGPRLSPGRGPSAIHLTCPRQLRRRGVIGHVRAVPPPQHRVRLGIAVTGADLTAAGWHMLDFTSRSTPERVVAAVLGAVHQRQAEADAGLKPTSWSAASAGSSP